MTPNLTNCNWPELDQPYDQALREAVAYILERFNVHGIIVSGSIIAGNPGPNSDLDICVVNAESKRQRIQKFFNGVPAEIFANPPKSIRDYFESERKRGRPSTAHMFATGFVILKSDSVVDELRTEAVEWRQKQPEQSELALTMERYFNADEFENSVDLIESDPATASLLMHHAIYFMVHHRFLAANQNIPRHKELLSGLKALDPAAGKYVELFYTEADLAQKFILGKHAAQLLNGATSFFEWESELETIESC